MKGSKRFSGSFIKVLKNQFNIKYYTYSVGCFLVFVRLPDYLKAKKFELCAVLSLRNFSLNKKIKLINVFLNLPLHSLRFSI